MTNASGPHGSPDELRASLRTALKAAMRDRDTRAVAALRSALGAIDNAEAIPVESATQADGSPIAGASVGLGSTEAARHELTLEDIQTLLAAEIEERQQAAIEIARAGHQDRADDLQREVSVLQVVLDPTRS